MVLGVPEQILGVEDRGCAGEAEDEAGRDQGKGAKKRAASMAAMRVEDELVDLKDKDHDGQ